VSSPLSTLEQQDEEVKCLIEDISLSATLYDVVQQDEEVLSMVKQFSLSAEVSNADSNLGVLNVCQDLS
jgi:hypothetical protein